jgi:uncharacterized protein YkwD
LLTVIPVIRDPDKNNIQHLKHLSTQVVNKSRINMRSVAVVLTALAASAVAAPLAELDARALTVYQTTDVYTTITETDTAIATNVAAVESSQVWKWKGSHHKHSSSQAAAAPAPSTTSTPEAPAATSAPPANTQVASTPASSAPAATSSAPAASSGSATVGSTGAYNGDVYAQRVIDHHNIHRSNHSAGSVTWDANMAAIALEIANSCNYAHNTQAGGGGYGQNIAAGAPADNITSVITDIFYNNEMPNYASMYGQATPANINDEKAFDGYGHFTQIVWKGTTSVGCATVDCTGKKNGPQGLGNVGADVPPMFTVCNYSPPGMFLLFAILS